MVVAQSEEQAARAACDASGQAHLFAFWEQLDDVGKERLLRSVAAVDVAKACETFKTYGTVKPAENVTGIEPVPASNHATAADVPKDKLDHYFQTGLSAMAAGSVAAVVLAGGQATRLGAAQPKGALPLRLPSAPADSLLHLQAGQIAALQRLAQKRRPEAGRPVIHWYVMTSAATDCATREHMAKVVEQVDGVDADQVHFITQAEMPCFGTDGKILLADKDRVATSPNGNGGLYSALAGELPKMHELGVKYVHVYCVDNVLCRVADPHFVGFCVEAGADCAAKVVTKTEPGEQVGVVCRVGGVPKVLEYSEISAELAAAADPADATKLLLRAGNIANHFFTTEFLQRVCGQSLPYHPAHKKIPHVNTADGTAVVPKEPNGIKMELFVFDVFQFSNAFYIWEVPRLGEFAPLKNADGPTAVDCPRTCRRALCAQHAGWLRAAGATVKEPERGEGPEEDGVQVAPGVTYAGEGLEELVKGKEFTPPVLVKPQ